MRTITVEHVDELGFTVDWFDDDVADDLPLVDAAIKAAAQIDWSPEERLSTQWPILRVDDELIIVGVDPITPPCRQSDHEWISDSTAGRDRCDVDGCYWIRQTTADSHPDGSPRQTVSYTFGEILEDRAELVSLNEARDQIPLGDFDYILEDGSEYDPRLVKVGESWFDVFDMMSARSQFAQHGYHAEHVDTFYSAYLFRLLEDDDVGFVRVASIMS